MGAGKAACPSGCFRHAGHDTARFYFAKQGNIADSHTRCLTPSWRSDAFCKLYALAQFAPSGVYLRAAATIGKPVSRGDNAPAS
jgi:hypothetical protein